MSTIITKLKNCKKKKMNSTVTYRIMGNNNSQSHKKLQIMKTSLQSCICPKQLIILSIILIKNKPVKSINVYDVINEFTENQKPYDSSRYHISKVLSLSFTVFIKL